MVKSVFLLAAFFSSSALSIAAAHSAPTTGTVSGPVSCAELAAAIAAPKTAAVTLSLPAGNCPMPVLNGVKPAFIVTITSQNPAMPAILTGDFKVANSGNLTFSHLVIDFSTTDDPYWAGRVSNATNLVFDSDEIRGAGPTFANPGGFYIAGSTGITFTNNKIHDIASAAIDMSADTDIVIRGNDFYRWAKSAVQGAQLVNFQLINNNIHDAFPIAGTHADGLQIYSYGTTSPSNNLTVTGNHMWVGDGWAFQGMLISDDVGTLPITNLTVSGNVLKGTMWNSILVCGIGSGSSVTNNQMVSWAQRDIGQTKDLSKPVTTAFTANLVTCAAPGAKLTVTGNSAQGLTDQTGRYAASLPGNRLLAH